MVEIGESNHIDIISKYSNRKENNHVEGAI